MKHWVMVVVAVTAAISFMPLHVRSPDARAQQSGSNPLAPFERLVGGQWHLEGSYQEFEWGVGHRSVKARNYFMVDGCCQLNRTASLNSPGAPNPTYPRPQVAA